MMHLKSEQILQEILEFPYFSTIIICFVLLWGGVSVRGEENKSSSNSDFVASARKLSDLVSDKDILSFMNPTFEFKNRNYTTPFVPLNESRERFIAWNEEILKTEFEFIKFNLLRGFTKKITLIWYNEEGFNPELLECVKKGKKYIDDGRHKHVYEISNNEDMTYWKHALASDIIRPLHASNIVFGHGFGGFAPIPPHGILFETDKEKKFIGILLTGFYLGEWNIYDYNEARLDKSKIFYWPDLALFLDYYSKKNNLPKYPRLYLDTLSGKGLTSNPPIWKQKNNNETDEKIDNDQDEIQEEYIH
jgi:hypothetical protein